jgi:hypothetical protein
MWTRTRRRMGHPKLLSGVGEMISAHSARETAAQMKAGRKKMKKGGEKGGEPKHPRARAKATK